jgi:hypothetical protein
MYCSGFRHLFLNSLETSFPFCLDSFEDMPDVVIVLDEDKVEVDEIVMDR